MAITTKLPLTLAACGCALIVFSTGAFAQKVEVSKPKISIEIQKTPRFNINGPKEKRDTQKFWVEVEVEFKADQKGDPKIEYIEELEFKYFITVTPKDPSKRKVYTLTIVHGNIPKDETVFSVAYMSPTTLGKIIGKNKLPTKTNVDVAVEIRHQGQLIAGDSTKSPSSKWWNKMSQADGMVLNKDQTPFAPLWLDRYVEVKGN